jgi:hypothetical protein
MSAVNNVVKFMIDGRTHARFYPTFKIVNYTQAYKPLYLFIYKAGDTVRLRENSGYTASLDRINSKIVIQLDTTIRNDTAWIYLASEITLAVTMNGFRAVGGDASDTLYWQTASEQDNLGFNLQRRIKPQFFDSLMKVAPMLNDSTSGHAAKLARQNNLSVLDTSWVTINNRLISGAPSGVSYGVRKYRQVDYRVLNDLCYEYRLEAVDYEGKSKWYGPTEARPHVIMPLAFALYANYPNPFAKATTIRFDIPAETRLELNIYNLQGRLVRRLLKLDKYLPGYYHTVWNGKDEFGRELSAGPYIYEIKAKGFAKAKVMFMVR